MSQITREINKITGTIIGISGKLIIYALVVLLLVEGVSKGYEFGHEVFYATAVDDAPGKDITVTFDKGVPINNVASDLHKLGLIKNQYAFVIQTYFYEYTVNPGTYLLNTSMTSKEILDLMNEEPEEVAEETQAPPSEEVATINELPEAVESSSVPAEVGVPAEGGTELQWDGEEEVEVAP